MREVLARVRVRILADVRDLYDSRTSSPLRFTHLVTAPLPVGVSHF